MAGGNFVHRVLSYVVNELVVNGLANSPAFQRFAVRTSRRIDDISNIAAKKKQELAEQMKDLSKNIDCPWKWRYEPALLLADGAAYEMNSWFILPTLYKAIYCNGLHCVKTIVHILFTVTKPNEQVKGSPPH
ncbi:hypothetical protein D5086_012647 [Populus alba]|uniref:Uncharacterized protein n=1 Tax=Populus alba TaxID=43335 RepID=A0ACC4C3A0_POPAL